MMSPITNKQTLFTLGDEWIKFENPLPSFWSDKVSKTFARTNLFETSYDIELMAKSGMVAKDIEKRLKPRGINVDVLTINHILSNPEKFRESWKKYVKEDRDVT